MAVCDFHEKCCGNKYIWVVVILISYESLVCPTSFFLFKPLKINIRLVAFSAITVDYTGAKIPVAKFLS